MRRNRGRSPGDDEPWPPSLLDDGDRLLGAFDALRTRKLDAARIRVHGDLHLGQALWTGHDVVFIDFEGEPGRSIGERSIKRSPLTDVAGHRALARLRRARRPRDVGRAGPSGDDEARPRAVAAGVGRRDAGRFWSTLPQTLRAGTTAAGPGSQLIPADPADARLLLDAHVLLKALYEVRYELANRPAWVAWPLGAIVQMLRPS